MARSLLIALMSVMAVAGPATALSGPVGLPEPPGSSPLEAALAHAEEEGESLACGFDACPELGASVRCRPYYMMFDQNNWPNFQFEYDPDYCIRRLIDDVTDWPPYPVRLLLDAMAGGGQAQGDYAAATSASAEHE